MKREKDFGYRKWGRFFEDNLYWIKCALIEASYQEKKSKGGKNIRTRFDGVYEAIPSLPYSRLGVTAPGASAYFWLGEEASHPL